MITAIALLLIAIGIGHKQNGSWAILVGFALAAGTVIVRLWSGGGILQVAIELFRDMGISLVLAAAYMGVRKLAESARPFLILGIASLVLSGVLFGIRVLWQSMWDRELQSILVELGPDDSIGEVEGTLNRFAETWERAFPTVSLSEDIDLAQVYLIQASPRHINSLMDALWADSENVDYVEINTDVHLSLPVPGRKSIPSSRDVIADDPYIDLQWGLSAVRAHEAHAVLKNVIPVRKARVAILDTGVESVHDDLQAVYAEGVDNDAHGHGTHCAGLAGAVTNNGLGISSLNWEGQFIEILGFRALSESGQGSLEQIAQSIIDATKAQADIISMSLGSKSQVQPRVLVNAVEYALNRGVIIAASAGNSSEDAIDHFPSNIDGVIAVAAVDQDLSRADFSNMVGNLSRPLAAPGVDIYSSFLDGQYKSMSGTSMATPMVAGLVGVMRSMDPKLTSEEAFTILHETGTEIPDTPVVGRLINAEAALKRTMRIKS